MYSINGISATNGRFRSIFTCGCGEKSFLGQRLIFIRVRMNGFYSRFQINLRDNYYHSYTNRNPTVIVVDGWGGVQRISCSARLFFPFFDNCFVVWYLRIFTRKRKMRDDSCYYSIQPAFLFIFFNFFSGKLKRKQIPCNMYVFDKISNRFIKLPVSS